MRAIAGAFAGLVLWTSQVAAQNAVELPNIGEPADRTLSPLEESRLGKSVVRQLHQHGLILDDPELSEYIRHTGLRLASFSEANPRGFEFFIVRDPRINAFALPGGYIGINAGLLLAARNESELAGVLSHEIAHVTQRHVARQIEASKGLNLAALAALLVALVASGGSGDLAQAALTLGISATQQLQINFTRAHELEADRIGIHTLASAGYDPDGMASFFQHLEEQSRLYGSGPPELLRTHPINVTRVSEARTRAAAYPAPAMRNEQEFGLMQARLRVLSSAQAGEALEFFQGRNKASDAGSADRYGLALAHLRGNFPEPAAAGLQKLLDADQGQIHYHLALARAQLAGDQPKKALGTYARARELFPNSLPLTAAYAEALLRFGQAGEARKVILSTSNALNGDLPDMHRLLAVSAQDLGWQAEALYRMAEHYQLVGDYAAAYNQLEAGLRLQNLSSNDRARFQSRLEALRKEAPEIQRR